MIPTIGTDVMLAGTVVHVCDRDLLNSVAYVGEADENGIIWHSRGVRFSSLMPLPDQGNKNVEG